MRTVILLAALAAGISQVRGATIYYVGTLTNSQEAVDWLKPATAKTYAITGNSKYGNYCAVHWKVVGTYTASSLSYIAGGGQYKQPEYARINNLLDATQGNLGPNALVNNNPTNDNSSISLIDHTFQVNEDLTGKVLRVGVMEDILGPAEYPHDNSKGVRIVQSAGGTVVSVIAPLPTADGKPEMVFFDIVNAQVGDRYRIEEVRNVGATDTIIGYIAPVAWDTNLISAVANAPTLLAVAGDGTCRAGSDYVLGVLAGGAPTPTYQWYKGASPVAGATDTVLWLTNLALADSASYKAVATTSIGSVTSSPVTLTVVSSNLPSRITGYRAAIMAEPNLVSYYTFDQGAKDNLGTHDGTLAGTAAIAYQLVQGSGRGIDKAALLRADGRANLGDVADFDFSSGNGTIEMWLRADWTNNIYNPCIVADRDDTIGVNYSMHMGGTKDSVGFWNGTVYHTMAIPQASTNWHHLGIIFTSGSWILVWDGQIKGTNTEAFGGAAVPTQIGSSSPSGGQENFMGALDEVAFYSDALSPERITAHYSAFIASDPPAILAQPDGNILPAGMPFQLTLLASGNLLTYQWYKDGSPVPSSNTNSLNFASLALADAGTYLCVVSNLAGAVTSSPAVLQISSSISAAVTAYETAVQGESSLISFYKFNDLTANDSKGGNHGTLQGTTKFRAGFSGGPDQALVLTGSGWDNLGAVPDFDFSDFTGTVELWLRADWTSVGYNPCVFADRNDASGTVNYSIHMSAGKNQLMFWNGSNLSAFNLPALAGAGWHHLGVVFDSGNWTVIWDGQNLGTNALFMTANSTTTQIGSSAATGAEQWVGGLDEVAFYADALDASKVLAHFNAYYSLIPPSITTQPQGGSYLAGNGFSLSVGAVGANLHYQWYKNNAPVGTDSAGLAFATATTSDSGNYFVIATNTLGRATSAVAVVSVVAPAVAQYQSVVRAEPSLISYYPFDAANANDLVSTHNGTAVGSPAFLSGLGGGTNLALVLDGISSFVSFGDVPAFDVPTGSGTFEAWVRAGWDPAVPLGYSPCIVADEDTARYYEIRMTEAKSAITVGATAVSSFSIPLAGTGWHYLAVVWVNPSVRVYWDGQFINQLYVALQPSTPQPTQLGSTTATGANLWMGALDEVAFYSDSLSADAISKHYNAMFTTGPAPRLTITASGGNVIMSWPSGLTGWVLEAASQLPAPSWTTVATNGPATNAVTGKQQFFRLRKP